MLGYTGNLQCFLGLFLSLMLKKSLFQILCIIRIMILAIDPDVDLTFTFSFNKRKKSCVSTLSKGVFWALNRNFREIVLFLSFYSTDCCLAAVCSSTCTVKMCYILLDACCLSHDKSRSVCLCLMACTATTSVYKVAATVPNRHITRLCNPSQCKF